MAGRPILALGLSGLIIVLAGCASHSPRPAASNIAGSGQGYFKIGAPYQVDGVWYTPHEDPNYDGTGIASWYGEAFHGRYTANGEVFNLNDLTAAHPTLPLPSIVQVTNLDNGRSLALRVNDRGPYVRGRIIDVSRRAAQLLGFEVPGTAKVRVTLLEPETLEAQALARRNIIGNTALAAASPTVAPSAVPGTALAALPPPAPPTAPGAPPMVEAAALPPPVALPPPSNPDILPYRPTPVTPSAPPDVPPAYRVATTTPPAPVERIQSPELPPLDDAPAAAPRRAFVIPAAAHPAAVTIVKVPATSNIYIQAGAFAKASNAQQLKARLAKLGITGVTDAKMQGGALYRVRIGPVPSVDEADRLLGRLVEGGLPEARIIVD